MFSPHDFRWTSWADLCRALCATLESEVLPSAETAGTSNVLSPEARVRRTSIHVLAALAGEEAVRLLTQILVSSDEYCTSRNATFRALRRLGARIDTARWIEWVDSIGDEDQYGVEFAGMVLTLCAPDEALLSRLRSADASETKKLAGALLARPSKDVNASVRNALLEAWLAAWRSRAYPQPDLQLASRAALHLGIDDPLLELCTALAADKMHRFFWHAVGADALAARRVADKLEMRHSLAEKLMLPPELLLEQFGKAGCTERLWIALTEAASHLVNRRIPSEVRSRLNMALRLLMQWPDDTFDRLFQDCVISSELEPIRKDLVLGLWHRDPEAAWEIALRAMEGNAPPSVGTELASLLAHDPPTRAEALFRWAVDHAHGRPKAHSVIALEHLGYDGPEWRHRLAQLADEELPALRFNARAALGRRGEDRWLEEVVERAEQDSSESVRAEALHALGDADPERHLQVLGRAFLEDHSPDDVCCSPGAEAASYELARWGSPDAMTHLVRGFFRVTTSCLFSGVMSHLQAFAARRPGWWDVSPFGRFNYPSVRDRTVLSRLSWLNTHNP